MSPNRMWSSVSAVAKEVRATRAAERSDELVVAARMAAMNDEGGLAHTLLNGVVGDPAAADLSQRRHDLVACVTTVPSFVHLEWANTSLMRRANVVSAASMWRWKKRHFR